jgi:hypothetical protein
MRLDTREGKPLRQSCPRFALPPLSHPATLRPPIGDEPPPRRSPMTPPARQPAPVPHPSPSLTLMPTRSMPMGTEVSEASHPLLPRHQSPLATVVVAQSLPADQTGRRTLRSPRPDHVAHAPWMPRAPPAFPHAHTRSGLMPHMNVHSIECTSTRHPCIAP